MTVNERLNKKIADRKISYRELSNLCGVPTASIHRYATKRVPIPVDKLEKIARALLTTVPVLMGYEQDLPHNAVPVETRSVPLLGSIAAGEPIFAQENRETYIELGSDIQCDFALIVDGDSMAPTIERGDIVFIRKQSDVDNGQIAAVLIDDSATLKRIYHIPNGLTLVSDNTTKYPPRTVTMPEYTHISIMGLAVAYKRTL